MTRFRRHPGGVGEAATTAGSSSSWTPTTATRRGGADQQGLPREAARSRAGADPDHTSAAVLRRARITRSTRRTPHTAHSHPPTDPTEEIMNKTADRGGRPGRLDCDRFQRLHHGSPRPPGRTRASPSRSTRRCGGQRQGALARAPTARTRAGLVGRPHRRRDRAGQGHEREGRHRHALRRQRLVERADRGPEGRVRQAGHRGRRRHRRRLQAGEAGLRHRDGADQEARHHRVHPHRPGRDRVGLQEGRRRPA